MFRLASDHLSSSSPCQATLPVSAIRVANLPMGTPELTLVCALLQATPVRKLPLVHRLKRGVKDEVHHYCSPLQYLSLRHRRRWLLASCWPSYASAAPTAHGYVVHER